MPSSPIHILLVEDSPADARLVCELLGEAGDVETSLAHVSTLHDAEVRLRDGAPPDVVLLDLSLPDSAAPDTVARVVAAAPEVPIVVMTAAPDEKLSLEALRAGAQDYLSKDAATGETLVRAIRYAAERVQRERELQRTSDAFRESEARFRVVLGNSPVIVSTVDRELRYTWLYNPHPDFDAEACIGRRDDELAPAEDVAELVAVKREVLRSGRGASREVRVRVGGAVHVYDVRAEPLRDAAGGVTGVTVSAVDVTERERAERHKALLARAGSVLAASLEYEEMLESIVELAVPELADWCVLDMLSEEGRLERVRFRAADARRERLLGEMLALHPHDTSPEEHPVGGVLRSGEPRLLREITPELLDRVAESAEHRRILAELAPESSMIVPLVARDRVVGAITLTSAGSGRRFDEADLELAMELGRRAALAVQNARLYQRERLAVLARDEVLSVVAHDLRNPLGAIALYGHLLAERLPPGAPERGDAQAIVNLTEQANRLIEDLLDVGRVEAGRLAIERVPLPVSGILERAVELFRAAAEEKGIAFAARVDGDPPPVAGDPHRIDQVLSNLIGNALRFTPAGGRISLTVEPRGDEVLFSVADTGPGIAPEHLEHLFDRFWQAQRTHRSGAGLGLAIARGIVEAHGGRIRVESEPGVGTTVSFTVPRATGG